MREVDAHASEYINWVGAGEQPNALNSADLERSNVRRVGMSDMGNTIGRMFRLP